VLLVPHPPVALEPLATLRYQLLESIHVHGRPGQPIERAAPLSETVDGIQMVFNVDLAEYCVRGCFIIPNRKNGFRGQCKASGALTKGYLLHTCPSGMIEPYIV
jgi:hypothetical protein